MTYDTLDVNGLDFRLYHGDLGVNLSGGVDSSLLLYILMKFSKNKIHAFTISSDEKYRINSKTSVDVINRCIDLTGNFNISHHTLYQPLQNVDNLHYLPKQFLTDCRIDMMYTGITANPPIEVCNTFADDRIESRDFEISKQTVFEKERYYNPWANYHKQIIRDIYKHFEILDSLFPLTRSCEYYRTDTHDIAVNYHCGQCWWCQERLWGFGRL